MNRWTLVGRLVADHATPALIGRLLIAALVGGGAAALVAALLGHV